MYRKIDLIIYLSIIFSCSFSTLSLHAAPYYVQYNNPWGQTFNITAMNNVYGTGNWTQANYNTPASDIFDSSTNFVMLEGSDSNAIALNNFLLANNSIIEAWVYHGGRLFINAAPNIGGDINLGFDSTVLHAFDYSTTLNSVDTADSIFHMPYLPVAISYTGNYTSHAHLTGTDLDTLLTGSYPAYPRLASKSWGLGKVYFGCLTQPNWWQPQPQAPHLWYNILYCAAIAPTPTATGVLDSFAVYTSSDCNGLHLFVTTPYYAPPLSLKTYFGDSFTDSSALLYANPGGTLSLDHLYENSGNYTIKHILYNGANVVDSASYSYHYQICNDIQVSYYYDNNNNCIKDISENLLLQSALVEVDSNNIPVDTVSAISGFYYKTMGNAGDIFSFKFLAGNGYYATCPATGIYYDTLTPTGNSSQNYVFGLSCTNNNTFDLAADYTIWPTGILDQQGHIYIRNNRCLPQNATVTLYYSPKYVCSNINWVTPAPTTLAGDSIVWTLNNLSSNDVNPVDLHYIVWHSPNTGPLTIGDTVQEHIFVRPLIGDGDTTNNIIIIHDTVKDGCDPNRIQVTPEGHIAAGTKLRYKIEFENTGNDTAHNIYVLDTLPNEVDLNSMRMITSTHTVYVTHLDDGNHNILKFDFPNINLLDSSYHDACTGTFSYTINSRSDLPDGTLIDHQVGIYFDYNEVVMTNVVENIIGFPITEQVYTSNTGNDVRLYPNPASNELTIQAPS